MSEQRISGGLVLGIAAIIDRLDAYAGSDPASAGSVRDDLLELLALNGVHPVECRGAVDSSLHRVVRVVEQPEAAPGAVVAVWARGYASGETVIRHAQVVVNRPRKREGDGPWSSQTR
jgi:molecular chaperone GrpE (heat shock protein)